LLPSFFALFGFSFFVNSNNKSLEKFDTDFQKGVTKKQLETLAKLDWLDALFNLILIGPPGTGRRISLLRSATKLLKPVTKFPSFQWIN
jgi:DNA replication protein DnaC